MFCSIDAFIYSSDDHGDVYIKTEETFARAFTKHAKHISKFYSFNCLY